MIKINVGRDVNIKFLKCPQRESLPTVLNFDRLK